MNNVVKVGQLEIGNGIPKICVPIIADTRENILQAARKLNGQPFDLVEWRADFFVDLYDTNKVMEVLQLMHNEFRETPILFTIRTSAEGGNIPISIEDYIQINSEAANSGLVDLIDVEIMRGDDVVFVLVETAHDAGIKVIASNHDFRKTPKKEELITRLCRMQELDADIAKIAVMPRSERDVLVLLDTTLVMKELHGQTPVVTMSMGDMGRISRISGGVFGSAITFGTAGDSSAPGQMPLNTLHTLLKNI